MKYHPVHYFVYCHPVTFSTLQADYTMEVETEIVMLKEIELHKKTILSKDNSKHSRDAKIEAWEKVKDNVCRQCGKDFTVTQLKKKWDNARDRLKQKLRAIQLTGGGTSPDLGPRDNLTYRIVGETNPVFSKVPGAYPPQPSEPGPFFPPSPVRAPQQSSVGNLHPSPVRNPLPSSSRTPVTPQRNARTVSDDSAALQPPASPVATTPSPRPAKRRRTSEESTLEELHREALFSQKIAHDLWAEYLQKKLEMLDEERRLYTQYMKLKIRKIEDQ